MQYVAVCGSLLQYVAEKEDTHELVQGGKRPMGHLGHFVVAKLLHRLLQRVAACCSALQRVAEDSNKVKTLLESLVFADFLGSVLQRVAACCSVLQRVAEESDKVKTMPCLCRVFSSNDPIG